MTKMSLFILFLWLLLHHRFIACNAIESDIDCLKSIKESLEDPLNILETSWNFDNHTEGFICKFTGVECWHADENKVLNIRLSDMGLKGNFPRGLGNCTALTGLDLSRNNLFGSIPRDISKMLQFVTSLDLSNNNFSGEIPNEIADCSYLFSLSLDHNQLIGQIPPIFGQLSRISTFNVANNHLSGPVPRFNNATTIITADSYANNAGLCGSPLKNCKHSVKHDDDGDDDDYRTFFISGFVIGWSIVTILVLLLVLFGMPPITWKLTMMTWKWLNQSPTIEEINHNNKVSAFQKLVTRISFKELSKVTDNFNEYNIIGQGKMGTMYKAMLPNGWFLAIKKFNNSICFEEQFESELLTIGRLRHTNLLPLISFCSEKNERLLVYHYASNGNLYDLLHTTKGEAKTVEWPLRVKIAFGLARGLAWLHHNAKFQVVHHKVSSKCILLDLNFEPKISNFGDANFTYMNTIGSSRSFSVNGKVLDTSFTKRDVYSFGVVLLELVIRKEPSKLVKSCSNSFDGNLVEWVNHLLGDSNDLYKAIDKALIGQGYDGEIIEFLRIAFNCIQSIADQRPTMLQVHKALISIATNYGFSNNDFNLFSRTEICAAVNTLKK